jgi:hypothetical protein
MHRTMPTVLVGFDSAWTPHNSGALVGVLRLDDGTFRDLGPPQTVNYPQAEGVILGWQQEKMPTATIVLLDQPTVVKNTAGQRRVENIVGSAVGIRRGRIQPANTSKESMFGPQAPLWQFLTRFGGPADPFQALADKRNARRVNSALVKGARSGAARLVLSTFQRSYTLCHWAYRLGIFFLGIADRRRDHPLMSGLTSTAYPIVILTSKPLQAALGILRLSNIRIDGVTAIPSDIRPKATIFLRSPEDRDKALRVLYKAGFEVEDGPGAS